MKTLRLRLPDSLFAEIDAESRARKVSRSDVVRERLHGGLQTRASRSPFLDGIADLIGSVDGTPEDLSAGAKFYLKRTGHGQERPR